MSGSEVLTVLKRLAQRFTIHELDFSAQGNALRQAADPNAGEAPGQLCPQVGGRIFGFDSSAQRQNDFFDLPFGKSGFKVLDVGLSSLLRAKRRKQAAENEITPFEEAAFFQRQHAVPFVDDTELFFVARRVGADGAGVGFGQRAAARAQVQFIAQPGDAFTKLASFCFRPFEQRHGDTHGRLGAQPRKTAETAHQRL